MGPAGCLPLGEDKYRGTPDTDRRPGAWAAPWLGRCLSPSSPCTHSQAPGRPAPPGLANPPGDVSQQARSGAGWPQGHRAELGVSMGTPPVSGGLKALL